MTFIEFLQGVPAPAWGLAGAAVGVLGTLGATALSNRSNDKRFEKQLKNDAEQRSKDRAASLRRDVYLNAAEELTAINTALGQLASLDPADTGKLTASVMGFFKATAKVSLVAGKETRKKVAELSGAYGELFVELMIDASDVHRLKADMNINRGIYESLHTERVRIVSAMRDVNENEDSKYMFEALSSSYEGTNKQVEELSEEFTVLGERHNEAIAAFATSAAAKVASLDELRNEASALLSEELEVAVDLEGMKAVSIVQSAKGREALQRMLAKLKKIREDDADNEAKEGG